VAAPWQQAPPDWGAAQQQPPPWQQQAPPQAGWYGGGPPQGYGAPQQLPPPGMQFMQPQQQYAQFRPQDAYGGGYGGTAAPMMVMMAPQQGYGGGYPGAPDGGMGMYGHAPQQGGPMGFAPQQQQQMQPLGGTMQPPWMPPPGMPPPAPPPAQAPPAGGSALASLLQGLAAGIVSGKLSGAPGGGPGGPGGASLPPRPSIGTAFTAEALRAAPAASLRVLYDPEALQCAATGRRFTDRGVYSAHLDLQYLQKRREKEGKAQSRRWFVPLDAWIAGAAAPTGGDDPSPFGDAPGGGAAAEPPGPPPSVPVDEAQPACALTGESFETFWNAELEEWHYRGAVRLERPAGGVPAGRLVLAKAVPREGDAAAGAALRVAESRALAADLAAAAAAADEAALPPPYVEPVAPPAAAQTEPPPAAQAPAEPPAAAAEDVKRPLEAATDGAEDASGEPASKRQRNAE
jgi:pre-mRNA cleavage complex 2 protein Pcf11